MVYVMSSNLIGNNWKIVNSRHEIVLNYWPSSQICMECNNGRFISGEAIPDCTYKCSEGIVLGSCAISCDAFDPKEEALPREKEEGLDEGCV